MPRSTRMFEIIQLLRAQSQPCTAAQMAETLEVTKRTIYRDIAALQAMRVPIEGEAGIGYLLRRGYDLPPVNFNSEEAEAISVGLSLIARTGDTGLIRAAASAARKLAEAAPVNQALKSTPYGADPPASVDLSVLREAIREERKVELAYRDEKQAETIRQIRPIAMIYYTDVVVLVAWCELRGDFRHFRPDRIVDCRLLAEGFSGEAEALRAEWDRVVGWEV